MVGLVIDDEGVAALAGAGASLEDLLTASTVAAESAGVFLDAVRRQIRATFRNQTGALENSFQIRFTPRKGERGTDAEVVSDLAYAGIQNYGGTILPRVARNLAVPLPGNPNPRKWPREYGDGELYPIKSRRGNRLLMSRADGRPMFVLKKSVTLPATGYLEQAAVDAEAEMIDRAERTVIGMLKARGL